MNDQAKKNIKRIVAREGLILFVVFLFSFGLLQISSIYQNKLEEFRNTHSIKLVDKEGKKWGVFSIDPNFAEHPDAVTEVLDINGNRREMGKDMDLRASSFDLGTAMIVDATLSDTEKKIEDERIHNVVIKRRALIIQALKADNRATPIIGITASIGILAIFSYFIYILARLILLARWTVKIYGMKKILNGTKMLLKIAFSKEFLIRTVLILGVLFLSVSLLKSCGFMNFSSKHRIRV